jgi:hypothetical protein
MSPVVSLPTSRRPSNAGDDPSSMVGSAVQLTVDGRTHQGTLWCYDALTGCLALEATSAASSAKRDYKIFKASTVSAIQVLALPSDVSIKAMAAVQPVSLDRVKANVDKAIEADRQRAKRLGEGVSQLAQEVFDALSKSEPPLRWQSNY